MEGFRNREDYDPTIAKQIYGWFIGPFAPDLEQAKIKTLVFVQDGILRSVPMAALHDGQQFLIQKYAIANTPSLTLTDPKALNRENLRVLALGLTTPATIDNQQFPALTNVDAEIEGVEKYQVVKSFWMMISRAIVCKKNLAKRFIQLFTSQLMASLESIQKTPLLSLGKPEAHLE